MTNYTRGVAKERAFVQLMLERGCPYAYRTAGSHSLFDVIAIDADSQLFLVQIKRTKLARKAHHLNAPACLELEKFADSINYRNNKHVTITWAVWVDYDKWYEYTLYAAGTWLHADYRVASNHIKQAYWAHQEGWVWVCADKEVWRVTGGVVMKEPAARLVFPLDNDRSVVAG